MSVETFEDTKTVEHIDVKEPSKYKVLLHNDDFTTFEFVVNVLTGIFYKPFDDAVNITKSIHNTGVGIAGVFTKEIAEEKVYEVSYAAQQAGFPLKTTMEEE